MSDIAKTITYGELENKEYQVLFKFTNGETVLGVINYDNGDVYMGEIKPGEKYDGKRDRRRHGYGKVFPKRGKVVDGEWHLGQVIGKSVTFDKKGKRTVEVRGSDPSFRSILYSYYLTDDNKYGGDNYNGLYKDKFWEGDFKDVLRRGELREQLLNGTVPTTTPSTSAQKSAPTKEKAPTKNNAVPKEPAVKAEIKYIEYDNGSYEGEIVDGYRHGKGKYTWADGSEYEGDWVKGKKCGFGIYRSYSKNEKDGSTYLSYIYEGEWKDGKKHGQGIAKKYKIYHLFGTPFMTWSHEGGYANGDMHGHGIYKEWNVPNDTGRVHEGEWVNNKRQGRFVWEYEPSVTGKKYIDFYDQGHSVVFGIDYDPSINTLEEAKRVKAENDAVRDRVIAERRAREAAQSRTSSTSHRSADSSDVDKAKKNGTVFTEWASIDPSMFNEAVAVSHEGCLVDMNSEILKQEQEQGYYYMKYHTARDGKKVTLYLFFYDEVIQEDYVCTDASMNHTELVKRKIYLCLPRGAGFSKKEIYVDGDGNQIGNGYLFATDVAPGINELADCISLPDEKWEFAGTLSPDGQYKKY